jgi:hypothetical protein
MDVRFVDEQEWGIGWIAAEPEFMQRCSHALVLDGKVWLVDAVDGEGVDEKARELGEPAGVVQLLDRHRRDCATLARRLDVPLHVTPLALVPDTPFRPLQIVRTRLWTEIALWWPERRVLVCGDALGTAPYYVTSNERLAVNPLLRLLPPQRLGGLEPAHILVGHGEGIHDRASDALEEALATSSRRIPRWFATQGWRTTKRAASRVRR